MYQLVGRPAFGNTVFKQLRADRKFNYYSEVIFASTKATTMDAGFYECRAYEPVNQGQERILDRAITNIVVHKPYPNKPPEHRDWADKFGYLLANYWQMLSERQLAVHEQQIQNDGDAKLKEPALPLTDLENFAPPLVASTLLESTRMTSSNMLAFRVRLQAHCTFHLCAESALVLHIGLVLFFLNVARR
ncbi:uncharacterized protein DEA37_0004502 [Paragonimus westermani]|uniref:Uncharacterized protein n=1 Tax=Paragonimus westermani TaxID=34504 RepID=A0A5J4NZB7_9TREM|nr:uncharacterized protein DEA37_0004502 [Paragonimus westermani]